jgi:hypothetical protein
MDIFNPCLPQAGEIYNPTLNLLVSLQGPSNGSGANPQSRPSHPSQGASSG